ncbi:4'-phosphopantetheinyl transferase [Alteromonas halophila]|uniref:4'-phosphopantetheinyl transferase n=2 Tax=Alteromonas halophila TaxID=516698 RepID=A0A918JK70_9ALTE|nr:4'-phosphopantetheinyl transferase [Alteromonas halophila]
MASGKYDACYAQLTADETQRVATFKANKRRQQFVIGRGALRAILRRYCADAAAEFCVNEHGKPALKDAASGVHFNLSHSGSTIAIAVAAQPVGVDIETHKVRRNLQQIADSVFHPREWHPGMWGTEAQQLQHFYRLWTLKEALVKATGQGLSVPLTSFYFDFQSAARPEVHWHKAAERNTEDWLFAQREISTGVSLAIALQSAADDLPLSIHTFEGEHCLTVAND